MNNNLTNSLLTAIIILLLVIFGVLLDVLDKTHAIKVDTKIIRGDTFDLVRGAMTGQVGEATGQEYLINKQANK
jgi:hypothetical protein